MGMTLLHFIMQDVLYNTFLTSILKLMVHSPVGKLLLYYYIALCIIIILILGDLKKMYREGVDLISPLLGERT